MKNIQHFLTVVFLILLTSCRNEAPKVFELLSSKQTGIDFSNDLYFDQEFNVYTYRNYYNGGGVALGDVNNDGLIDIYFTSNLGKNKLYLNKGNFKFEDVTVQAKVGGSKAWSTGVSMVDINGDGLLDIYVCNSGDIKGDNKQNELFINQGNLTFTEEAEKYGLADKGYSTHAVFFDYDKDGDLDVYILNNSYQAIGSFNLKKNERPNRDQLGGDKLMRNDGGTFIDVSEEAGIYGSVIGFGLGVTIGDVNADGWDDIYISNDFFERDYLYINNQDGTFSEELEKRIKSISAASMGADMADINNDGLNDIFVTDMLPRSNERIKSVTTFEDWNRYSYALSTGYYHQFSRNTLQINRGDGKFSEIGRMLQAEASDWSWGALLFDMDNDGYRDLFVANGIYQDLTDQDYLQYISNEEVVKSIVTDKKVNYAKLIEIIPSNKVSNLAMVNKGGLRFEDVTTKYGLAEPSFSNGSAYGDLDNDGDLDLVVNNVNMQSFVYRNNTRESANPGNYLRFELKGKDANKYGIGAKIHVTDGTNKYYLEQQPARGFQSNVDFRPFIGLASSSNVDVRVEWPTGEVTIFAQVAVNTTLTVEQVNNAGEMSTQNSGAQPDVFSPIPAGIDFVHEENQFVDFDRDRLTYHMRSTEGPRVAIADSNGDGIADLFVGGAKEIPARLYYGKASGNYDMASSKPFDPSAGAEDLQSLWFDVDNDGDLDLYVCSGGVEFSTSSEFLSDRMYINDGKGNLSATDQILPTSGRMVSSATVAADDFDGDGLLDLFVGERVKPFSFGLPCDGFLLRNIGGGRFEDVTASMAPFLSNLGLITDAKFADLDGDGVKELIIVGEYMSPIMAKRSGDKFINATPANLQLLSGWWKKIEIADLDDDGLPEIVLGNLGLNSRFRARENQPIKLYVGDFDNNGTIDPIMTAFGFEGIEYPVPLRHNLIDQMKGIKKVFPDYHSYKNATINDILTPTQLGSASIFPVNTLESVILKNNGSLVFEAIKLPVEANFSTVFAIAVHDFDGDGKKDIVMGGNLYGVKPEIGRYDACYGVFMKNEGGLKFKVPTKNGGLMLDGEVRDIKVVDDKLWVFRNSDTPLVFTFKR